MKYRIAFTSVASAISLVLAVVFVPTTMARSSAAPSGFCYYNCGGGGGGGSAPAKP